MYAHRSLYLFTLRNTLRWRAIDLIEWKWCERPPRNPPLHPLIVVIERMFLLPLLPLLPLPLRYHGPSRCDLPAVLFVSLHGYLALVFS
jgi:hypothetical protein